MYKSFAQLRKSHYLFIRTAFVATITLVVSTFHCMHQFSFFQKTVQYFECKRGKVMPSNSFVKQLIALMLIWPQQIRIRSLFIRIYSYLSSVLAKMIIFQTVQKYLATIGYAANRSPINSDTISNGLAIVVAITCVTVNLCIANTPREFMDAIFMTAAGILVFISFISTVQKMKTIFTFISKMQTIINEGEFNFILSKFRLLELQFTKYLN